MDTTYATVGPTGEYDTLQDALDAATEAAASTEAPWVIILVGGHHEDDGPYTLSEGVSVWSDGGIPA